MSEHITDVTESTHIGQELERLLQDFDASKLKRYDVNTLDDPQTTWWKRLFPFPTNRPNLYHVLYEIDTDSLKKSRNVSIYFALKPIVLVTKQGRWVVQANGMQTPRYTEPRELSTLLQRDDQYRLLMRLNGELDSLEKSLVASYNLIRAELNALNPQQ